jgi:putative spermidine/putrescine transport system permease protein
MVAASSSPDTAGEPRRFRPLILLLAPVLIFLAIFFLWPLSSMLLRSVTDPAPTLAHYKRLLAEPVYLEVMLVTFEIALYTTVGALLLGYPLAYCLSGLSRQTATLLMTIVIVPYFTSVLVRTYAWMVLLGSEGIVNQMLISLGVVNTPLRLMYNRFGVLLGMIYILLPYMVLSLYSVMRGIDRGLLRAADSLGAPRFTAFRRIFLPLSMPGVAAGCLLVFILSLGFFITPALMGSQQDAMISMIIEQQVETYFDWGFAAALSAVLLVVTLLAFALYDRLVGLEYLFRSR